MTVYFAKGRCGMCMRNKKVVKLHSHEDIRGLCRKCLEDLSKNPNLK